MCMPHFFRVFLPFFYDAYVVWPLNLVCRYSTHGLKCRNYGLSNAHTFVDTALSSGHIGVISTRTCISEPKLFLETISRHDVVISSRCAYQLFPKIDVAFESPSTVHEELQGFVLL